MKKIVVGNLKMNLLSVDERERYLKNMDKELARKKFMDTEIVLCPSFIHLEAFRKWKNKKIKRGAQNIFFEDKGSYTGEISGAMLKNFDCEFVIIGHSERRKYFNEGDEMINKKIAAALKNKLNPILCVGETKEEKDREAMLAVITRQIKSAFENISRFDAKHIIIAYEPIWSIGTDDIPTANEIMGAKLLIKKILYEIFGRKYADEILILYGGSVNVKTAKQTCLDSEMDGVLIGRESLTPREFIKIAEIINNK